MHDTALPLIELGAVFFGLGLLGRLAWRWGISPIPLYLIGGLAFGHGGLVPLEGIQEFNRLAAEIGVVLLLLLLGLEYSAAELMTGLRRSWLAGIVDLLLNAAPGAAVALLLGWGPLGAVVMAGITYISSSGITAKLLADLCLCWPSPPSWSSPCATAATSPRWSRGRPRRPAVVPRHGPVEVGARGRRRIPGDRSVATVPAAWR